MSSMFKPMGKYVLTEIEINKTDVALTNARKRNITEGLDELAMSINEIGLQQPPIAQKEGDGYVIIVGQRRFLAFRDVLKKQKIPVLLKQQKFDDDSATVASLVENIHRKEMNPKDLGIACKLVYDKVGTKAKAAKVLGIGITTFNKYLGYHGVPSEIQDLVPQLLSVKDATRLWNHVPNVARAKIFAKAIFKLPKPTRDRFFTALADDPNATPEQVKKRADKMEVISIRIHIPTRYTNALERAADSEHLDYPALGQKAVIEYLQDHGYAA